MSKPKILIDARMVGPSLHGIAKYVLHMAEAIRLLGPGLPYELIFLVRKGLEDETRRSLEPFEIVENDLPFLNWKETFALRKVIAKVAPALFHSPSFSSVPGCPCPWVQTIHDLNHLSYGTFFKRTYYERFLKPFALGAKKLMTVSEFSRMEISLWLRIAKTSIALVPNAIDPPWPEEKTEAATDRVLARFGLTRKRYFFSLSNSKPHKNLELLTKAYIDFRRHLTRAAVADVWPLVLSVPERDHLLPVTEGVVWTGYLSVEEVQVLLTQAAGLFYPSLYEGFGRPPLEAVVVGTPCVVSRIPPHEESLAGIGGKSVQYVAATDFQGWIESFHRIREGKGQRIPKELANSVLERFSLVRMAKALDRVYRDVLNVP